jgi:hypothetical protein
MTEVRTFIDSELLQRKMMEKRAEEILERIAVAVETLAEEPELEIPTSPPICPHCGQFNPDVHGKESEGTGPMSEFFLEFRCMTCDFTFFAVPQGWANFTNEADLKEFFERAEDGNSGKADRATT